MDLSMPMPDSLLTFNLRTAALELLTEHHGKWQTNLDLRGYASSPSHDSLKNNKSTEKFDRPIYSVPLVKNCQHICHLFPKSQESKHGRKHCAMGSTRLQHAAAYITWSYCLELNFKIHWDSLGYLPSEYLWFSGQEIETLDPFGKNNSGNPHLLAQFHLLSSAFQPSEGPQQPKSTSAQFSALPILQTWLSLVVSRQGAPFIVSPFISSFNLLTNKYTQPQKNVLFWSVWWQKSM